MRHISAAAGFAFCCIVLSAAVATAGYVEPVWSPEETIDSGQIELTSSAGPGIVHTPLWSGWDQQYKWHTVYAKAGDIYHAVRTSAGWLAPDRLTNDAAVSRDPKLAFMGNRLVVVWEDDRRGHPEIWSRASWDGIAWGPELAIADDGVPSRAPVVAGADGPGYVAWQEGADGATQILARPWGSSGWGTVVEVSEGSTTAIEPAIGGFLSLPYVLFAWADARDGDYEIHINKAESGGLWGDVALTNVGGSCRRPSVWMEECCGDVLGVQSIIAFENDATGVPEVWLAFSVSGYGEGEWVQGRVSADDGRPSLRPQAGGYPMIIMAGMGGAVPRYPVTWTEAGEGGTQTHVLGMVDGGGAPKWVNTLTTAGLTTSEAAGVWGIPDAGLMTAWLESRSGQTVLIAKPGTAIGCDGLHFSGPPCLVLSPGGTRGNQMLCTDECTSNSPVPGVPMALQFAASLDPLLTWDAGQAHPLTPPDTTGAAGTANMIVRGGGCSATGRVSLRVNGVEVRSWTGVKSPDVNGDCAVRIDDLAYVTSKVGTSDFCADLDGSGSVTTADVAIVQEALGSACSQVVGIEEPAGPETAVAAGLRITPNPARRGVAIRIETAGWPDARVQIFDAAGRLVREFGEAGTGQGADGPRAGGLGSVGSGAAGLGTAAHGTTAFLWDGLDDAGRPVPSGLYYVRCGQVGSQVAKPVVVVR